MKYVISLENHNDTETVSEAEKTLAHSQVKTKGSEATSLKDYTIQLSMSRNALLGLGTELIRWAHKKDQINKHWHIDPIRANSGAVQTLGIYLTPESVELIICSNNQK